MTEHYYRSVGAFTLPLTADDIDDTDLSFGSADPASTMMLDLFSQAITSELTAAWTKVCAGLNANHPLYNSTTPVGDSMGHEPTSELVQERVCKWPLLALHRTGEFTLEPHTLHELKRTQTWNLHYILGPRFSIETDAKLTGALDWVALVVATAIQKRGHPDYDSGNLQFFGTDADDTLGERATIGSVSLIRSQTGQAVFSDGNKDARYPALRIDIETIEYGDETLAAFPTVTGMDLYEHVGNGQDLLMNFVVADTDFPGPMYDE